MSLGSGWRGQLIAGHETRQEKGRGIGCKRLYQDDGPDNAHRVSGLDVINFSPKTGRHLIDFHDLLVRGAGPPSTNVERELIATHVSRPNVCWYRWSIHISAAELLAAPAGTMDGCATPGRGV